MSLIYSRDKSLFLEPSEEPQKWFHLLITNDKIDDKSDKLLAAGAAKSLQSCPALCNPIDGYTRLF